MSRFCPQVLLCSALAFSLCCFAHPAHAQTAMPMPAASSTPASVSLALNGPTQQTTLSLAALKALPHVSVTVTNGHSKAQETYAGVPLNTLLEQVGAPAEAAIRGKVLSEYIVATGSDNYHAVLSLAEIEPGIHPGKVLVADTLDGKPIDPKDGPLKLIVEEDQKPARWVRNLVKLELKQAE